MKPQFNGLIVLLLLSISCIPSMAVAPVINNLHLDTSNYTEAGPAVFLDTGTAATVTDADSTTLSNGNLTVSIIGNPFPEEDVISFDTSGMVGVFPSSMIVGSSVTVDGIIVGTITGDGRGGNDLVVRFSTPAPDRMRFLLGALTYRNANTSHPNINTRTIRITVSDNSSVSTPVDVFVKITASGDEAMTTFADAGGAAIPDGPEGGVVHRTVSVQGVAGPLTDLKVTIAGLTHPAPHQLDFLLVGPDGIHNLAFWSDAGGGVPGITTPVTVSVADFGAQPLPSGASPGHNTTWRAAGYGNAEAGADFGLTLSINHPAGNNHGLATFSSAFSGLTGPALNGPWSLYIRDSASGEIGSFSGWSLSIAANPRPVLNNLIKIGEEDSLIRFTAADFDAGFTDPNGGALTAVRITSLPTTGTLRLSSREVLAGQEIPRASLVNLRFSPPNNFNGVASFGWNGSDGVAFAVAGAVVNLTVTEENDAPDAVADTLPAMPEDAPPVTISAGSLITNDSRGPANENAQTLTVTAVSSPTGGEVELNAGTIRFTLVADFNGTASFRYTVTDNGTTNGVAAPRSSSDTVSFLVLPVNDPPVAEPQTVTSAEDTSRAITLSATDVEGDQITFAIVTPPAHGTLTGTGPVRTYVPALNYNGPDSFAFKANDGSMDSLPATVAITVAPQNDPPGAIAQNLTGTEDAPLAVALSASDIDGDTLSFAVPAPPLHGSLTGTAPNLTYRPAANYFGPDSFTFRVSDGSLNIGSAVISITVVPVNDAPTAAPQSVNAVEDTPKEITLTGSDIDGDAITFVIVTPPEHGSLTGSGALRTYTPAADYNGPDSFTFKTNDSSLDSEPATVSLNISAVNDPPVFTAAQPDIDAGPAAPDTEYDLRALLRDPDLGDSHSWRITNVSNPAIFASLEVTGGLLAIRYAPYLSGASTVEVEVADAAGETARMTVSVTLPVLPAPEVTVSGALALNRQTGLWEHRITLTNNAQRAIGGLEVTVSGLPADTSLYNASDSLGANPLAGYYQPVAVGATVTMVLEYYSPSRSSALLPVLTTSVALPRNPPAGAPGGLAVDRVLPLPGPALLIEFTAVPGCRYSVQYSADGTAWLDSPVPIRAAGNRVQWIDQGLPRTSTAPPVGGARFYRVREAAETP